MRQEIITFWKDCKIYTFIDKQISKFFRKRLKNDNFTILCSNCIGGVIYHRLGKEFLSPTINMFFSQPDFVSFCLNLDYYLEQDLHFIENMFGGGYPVAQLLGKDEIPTIILNFNHSDTETDAREKWESRKKRINKNNLYVIFYRLDGLTMEQIKSMEQFPCKNKVLLTAEPMPEVSWSYYIKPNKHQKWASAYLGKDIFGVRWFEKKFDFVDFLNK